MTVSHQLPNFVILKMGNFLNCTQCSRKTSFQNVLQTYSSTQSVTNYSVKSEENLVPENTKLSNESTPDVRFSWNHLQTIYSKSMQINLNDIKFSSEVHVIMKKIFNVIENKIDSTSRKFYQSLEDVDNTFPIYFQECINKNPFSEMEDKQLHEKLIHHTKCMMYTHKLIIDSLQTDSKEKINNILMLIAVGHKIMDVKPTYFKAMNMAMGEFLLKNDFIYEENAQIIVMYFNCVTDTIFASMNLLEDDTELTNPENARENYRRIKKWECFIKNIRKEINLLTPEEESIKLSPKISNESEIIE